MSWDAIECIHRNGPIDGYQWQLEGVTGGRTASRSLEVAGLQPYTRYTFRVAGINEFDFRGPFSEIIPIISMY